MDITCKQLIDQSLGLLGIAGLGVELKPEEYQLALFSLNLMLDSWSAFKDSIYTTDRILEPFVGGKQTYTLGIGGDINIERPAKIDHASVLVANGALPYEIPIRQLTVEEWRDVTVKQTTTNWPTAIWNDGNSPLSTIWCWPVPSSATASLVLYVWQPLLTATSLDTHVQLPKGYPNALIYNLALELAPHFGVAPSPQVQRNAMSYLHNIEDANSRTPVMKVPFGRNNSVTSNAYKSFGYHLG